MNNVEAIDGPPNARNWWGIVEAKEDGPWHAENWLDIVEAIENGDASNINWLELAEAIMEVGAAPNKEESRAMYRLLIDKKKL